MTVTNPSQVTAPPTPLAMAIDTLRWAEACLNWQDECVEEMLDGIPTIRMMIRETLASLNA